MVVHGGTRNLLFQDAICSIKCHSAAIIDKLAMEVIKKSAMDLELIDA
jgi:hypothetical protein